jgi:aldehyde dehydrogenase (NAD+)
MDSLKVGSPLDSTTQMGPQADKTQAATIERFLALGKQEGSILTGGQKKPELGPNYFQPTIFIDVADSARVNVEEIFGPFLVLHEFETEAEVVERANDTECKFYPTIPWKYRGSKQRLKYTCC